ncbi:MAG: DNA gyrase/topoisomerase IV subunit A [Paludibacteraceae bacterium]|nr:DNA gyrase/topoisomerase IV subunit A [Paludibacteraceae bacterium]
MNEDEKDFQEGTEKELESQEAENTDIVSDVQDDDAQEDAPQEETSKRKGRVKVPPLNTDETRQFLSGMYQTWFLDYASYVNLERAVPNIMDGLKPVQRRILHSMKRLDDGRYNKVANIVGHTMQFHPHGDASIGDALVTLGQKDLLIDCQGNWGHVLTGDSAAAPRYIEARLSKLALEILFSPKITEWKPSYDGRNKEPITLPVKFPLLLAQGTEGIGVGLNSKILPHNFNEIIDAAVAYLEEREFTLYPDFPTGGYLDTSRYEDGRRGGVVRIRAKINKIDNKTLEITEIPYGTTTGTLKDSIIKANERGKIKIKKVEDFTSTEARIVIQLQPGTSSDKAIDALYAFTQCEMNISPNCCVVSDNKPLFLGVSDVLRKNVDLTKDFLRQELEIQKNELQEKLFMANLEKIFIEERIYKDKEYEQSKTTDEAIDWIDKRLEPFKKKFIREVTRDDVAHLLDIKMVRIIKYNSDKADADIEALKDGIKEVDYHLERLVEYTIAWYKGLKARYGSRYPRKTEIRTFDTIEAAKVVEANERLYINREEGFIGTTLKKDEFVCNCSDIDDVIIFYKDGKYKVVKVQEKLYVGKNILYIALFKKNDKRTIYNVVYRDGKSGFYYIKRFNVTGVTRDKEYDLTQGKSGSKIIYFTANPNGEAETIKITHKPRPRLKVLTFEKDFSEIAIKGRQAMGNILTKNDVYKIALRHQGGSTLGGRKVWYDPDVMRLNYDSHGEYLGEFGADDQILVITKKGEYYTTNFDLSNHFDEDLLKIEKYDPEKVWTVALVDADQQGYRYIKRFVMESSAKKVGFIGENPESRLLLISDNVYPRFKVVFGGADKSKPAIEIDVEEFIGVKGIKAKGKRVSTFEVGEIVELEPTRWPEPEEPSAEDEQPAETEADDSNDDSSDGDVLDELTGQMKLF